MFFNFYFSRKQPTTRKPRYSVPVERNTTLTNMQQSDERFRESVRFTPEHFDALVTKLEGSLLDGSNIHIHERALIAVHWLATAATVREQSNLFNRGVATIARIREEFINAVLKVFCETFLPGYWIRNATPDAVLETGRSYARFFRGCVGAIDGTHIPVKVKEKDQEKYRNRKGYTSTNVLAVCDFRMRFTYMHVGVRSHVFSVAYLFSIGGRECT